MSKVRPSRADNAPVATNLKAGKRPPNPVLEHALWYASQGIYVNAITPNTKALVRTGPVLAAATRDPATIEEIFGRDPALNLGVVSGPESDLIIIDVDVKNGGQGIEALRALEKVCGVLPKTLVETTPSKGLHYFYRLTGRDVPTGKIEIEGIRGVEIFSRPHNICTSPSTIDGAQYQILERVPIVELPQVYIDYFTTHYQKNDKAGKTKTEGRNVGMFSEACRMRRLNMDETEAWDKLRMMNQRLCSPPLSEMELKKLFRSAWKYDPAYAMTELGNAQLFGDRHAHDLRWVFESKSWIVWGGFRWEFDKTGHVMQLMKTEMRKLSHAALDIEHDDARKAAIMWARKSEMRRVIDNSLALVPSEPGTTITQSQLDANPWLYACQNALIDLRTGKPVTAQREHLITKSANVQFDPSATCSRFIKFLDRILPNPEVRRFIQRYFGYALTADTREQCMLICWGTGSNGKSTLIGVMQNLMGDYGTQAATSTWMQKRDTIPNDVAALAGRRLVVSSEFEEGMRISQSLLKGATGEDKLSARFMRGEWFEFQPQFKIVFATNHKPVFDGGDAAMVRRIRLVEFGIKIPAEERDRTLPKQLEEEMPGIFNWLLAGCLEWQQHGLPIPDEVAKTTEEYARDSDNIGQFILDRCETKDKYNTASRPIYMAYLSWCAENNLRPYSVARFKQALIDRGFKSKRSSKGQEFQGLRCIRQDIEYKEAGEYEY